MQDSGDTVAREHRELMIAIEQRRDSSAMLLNAVLERLVDAVPALCSKIATSGRFVWQSGRQARPATGYAEIRGVRVLGRGPQKNEPCDASGVYEGRDVFVLEPKAAGGIRFAVLDYCGHWSEAEGAESLWAANFRQFEARALVDELRHDAAEQIVQALADLLEAHIGSRKTVTESAIRTAKRLRALVELF